MNQNICMTPRPRLQAAAPMNLATVIGNFDSLKQVNEQQELRLKFSDKFRKNSR